MSETDRIVEELQAVKFLLTLSNSSVIDAYMNEVVTSTPRRKMWTLIDGIKTQTDISKEVGTSQAAVSYFLTSVQRAGLVKYDSKTPPRRIISYTPPEWLKEIEEADAKQKPKEPDKVESEIQNK
jgi:predicted transcriptional regulator